MAKARTTGAPGGVAEARRKPGRPKDEAKGSAVLQAAANCFLRNGLEATSMDAIAREAGVSKLTVYNHFQNKETLFKEVIKWKCNEFSPPESYMALAGQEPRKALTAIATGFMRLMMAPEVLAMHRVVIGESGGNPKIAQLLYEAGPIPAIAGLAELLRGLAKGGRLEVRNPERAADHFFSMLRGDLHWRTLLNVGKAPLESDVKRHIDDCVETFLRAYGGA